MQQVEYSITKAEYWEFVGLARRRSLGFHRYAAFGLYVLLGAAAGLIPQYCCTATIDPHSLSIGALSVAGIVLVHSMTYGRYLRGLMAPDGSILAHQVVRVDEARIEVQQPFSRGIFAWKAIKALSDGKKILVLWTGNSIGLVVPKSAFKSIEELEAFRRLVEARIAASSR